MSNLPIMRTEQSKAGLRDMIAYLNSLEGVDTTEMVMAEVGAYEGDATVIFGENFRSVCAVDPWLSGIGDITDRVDMDRIYDRFKDNIAGKRTIGFYRMRSIDAAQKFHSDELDLVYIDAGHEYQDVYRDIMAWKDKVKKGGFICGHDYRTRFPGVIRAVNELLVLPDKVFDDTSWVVRV